MGDERQSKPAPWGIEPSGEKAAVWKNAKPTKLGKKAQFAQDS